MAKTQVERLARLEEWAENTDKTVARIEGKLDDFIKAADQRYASKTVERLVYGGVGIVLTAVVLSVLALINIHK